MLREYLNLHKKGIAVFFLFGIIGRWMFSLYHLPAGAVIYTVAICSFFGLIFLAVDYRGFCSHHRRLEQMKKNILVTADEMVAPRGLLERDYQETVRLLTEEKQRLEAEAESRYQELVDYYTVWVHQIKTPIAAMRLLLQNAEQRTKDCGAAWEYEEAAKAYQAELEQMREAADTIPEMKEELRRIEQYVEMVLCYLRLDAGATDYVIREYDLDAIVRQAVRKNASIFIRKKLRLEYEALHARVVTDEKWLLFVIEQILSNALKYTPSRRERNPEDGAAKETVGTISITLESPKTLCIRDNGIGISPEDLPRVFEKGYTGCNGRTDKKASGIGMYLCRRICGNLGHRIVVTSKEGEGTEVRLDLKNAELEFD